jgi:cyclophilin family peptidyl-prolyl cis-trans isomerase/HEAT repeat protein
VRPLPVLRKLLGAALLAACASAPPPPPPPAAVELRDLPTGPVFVQLDPTEIDDIATLLQMEDVRRLDADVAARLLRAASPEVRGRAALAVGRIGDRAGTPLLLTALQDSIVQVRTRAALALGKLADSSHAVITALSGVALRDRPAVAAEAAAALGRLRIASGRMALDSLLERDTLAAEVRYEALLAAWRLPRDAGTLQRLTRWTTDRDPELRWRAAYSLSRSYGADGLPALLAVATDADDRVRAYAVRALRAVLADSAGLRDRAFAAAFAAASDSHPHVRINALRVLPGYRDPRTTPILIAHLREVDENVALTATDSLTSGDAGASEALRAVTQDVARSDGLRAAALRAWLRVDPAAATPVATQWADSARWILRLHAARAFASRPWHEAGSLLQRLARDSHYLVAAAALAGADSTAELRALYIERLGAEHVLVRAAAARALGRRASIADFDVLLQAYDGAARDTINDAALAVLEALGRLRTGGVAVGNAFFLRFPTPPRDPALYRAIRSRIGDPPSSWPQPAAPEPRPRAFYVDIVQRLVAPALGGHPLPRAVIETSRGEIVLELASAAAPLTVHNFLTLLERGYYAGSRWHRVVPNFVIQDGDPIGNGSGDPGYTIRDEINELRYLRGVLGMAHAGPDTGSAQFFITHSAQPHLDGLHTIFGRVAAGMDVVDRIVQDDINLSFRIAR